MQNVDHLVFLLIVNTINTKKSIIDLTNIE